MTYLTASIKPRLTWSAQLALVGLCALALKFYYSTATADDLLWILRPTTALVELLSGQRFEFESYAGYASGDRRFVIAVPCAGVNFLITAFLMVALRRLWRERFKGIRWGFIPWAGLLAYAVTLLANTTRIWLALELRARAVAVSGLTNNQLHRLEGIVVYFTFLLLLFVLLERFESAKPVSFARFLLFPLVIYYAMALGVPLLNGSFRRDAFWEHSVYVLAVPLIVVVAVFCLERTRNLRTTLRTRIRVESSALFVKMRTPYDPHLPRSISVFDRVRSCVVRAIAALHTAATAADGNGTEHIH